MLSLPPCPKCGSKAVIYSHTTSTLLHVPLQTDENGKFIIPDNINQDTNYYTCKKCGENYHD